MEIDRGGVDELIGWLRDRNDDWFHLTGAGIEEGDHLIIYKARVTLHKDALLFPHHHGEVTVGLCMRGTAKGRHGGRGGCGALGHEGSGWL